MAVDQIQVEISIARAGIPREGYGMPMILTHKAVFAERIRFYADASEMVTDGFPDDSAEVAAATGFFSQTPKPALIAVGRAAGTVTQRYGLSVLAVRHSHKYQLAIEGEGFAATTVEYTSDANATDAEIAAGLVAAVNGIADKTFTATGAASPIAITADAPGNHFSVSVLDLTDLSIAQDHAAPAGVTLADDLAAIRVVSKAWYEIHTLYNSKAYVLAVAAWAAANSVIYAFDSVDSALVTSALVVGVSTDVGASLLALGYSGVLGAYHQRPAGQLAARWMGRWLPTLPGASNPAWKTLEGIEPSILTSTHKVNLDARRMNYYYETAPGLPITWQGTVFSTVYKYIDVRRNVDWLTDEIQKNIAGKFAAAEGIGFDDPGIQVAAGGLEESLQLAVERKVFPVNPKYTIEVPLASTISANDREERALSKLKFNGGLRGFVNKVIPIAGTVTL
jgi:hypothetical protein